MNNAQWQNIDLSDLPGICCSTSMMTNVEMEPPAGTAQFAIPADFAKKIHAVWMISPNEIVVCRVLPGTDCRLFCYDLYESCDAKGFYLAEIKTMLLKYIQ